ncbi:MAG: putative peptidoglycan binding domain-containing protein, partial [Actinocatenispora sp.]
QSAALLVACAGGGYGGSDIAVDLRIDDHPAPVAELTRLLDLHELYFSRPDPATLLPLTDELADEVTGRLERLGYSVKQVDDALSDWAGAENFEERLVPGRIDPLVLEQLRTASNAETGA